MVLDVSGARCPGVLDVRVLDVPGARCPRVLDVWVLDVPVLDVPVLDVREPSKWEVVMVMMKVAMLMIKSIPVHTKQQLWLVQSNVILIIGNI